MRTARTFFLRAAFGLGVFAVLLATFSFPQFKASAEEEPKRVLIFFGLDINHPAISTISQSLRSSLRSNSTRRIEFYPEYLDVRVQIDQYENELLPLLHRKYDGRKFDVVIALGPAALTLLLQHGDELFPNTPTVFATLEKSDLAGLDLRSDVTGVWTDVNFKANLDLALELYPQTKKVVVLSGISPLDTHLIVQ